MISVLKRPELTTEQQQALSAARAKREEDQRQREVEQYQRRAQREDFERRLKALRDSRANVSTYNVTTMEELECAEKQAAYQATPEYKAKVERERQEAFARQEAQWQLQDREKRAKQAALDTANAQRERAAAEAGATHYACLVTSTVPATRSK